VVHVSAAYLENNILKAHRNSNPIYNDAVLLAPQKVQREAFLLLFGEIVSDFQKK